MKNTKKIFILFLILFAVSIFFVSTTNNIQAANLLDSQEGFIKAEGNSIGDTFDSGTGDPVDIRYMIVRIIQVFLTFLGILAVIIIMKAGFDWMTSNGNDKKVEEAKRQMTDAIIGLFIILAAYIITDYIQDCVIDIATGTSSIWMCH